MQLYKKILVTIDCSPVDDVIVRHIAQLAKIHGSLVSLIHVVHSHTRDEDRALGDRACACLQAHADELTKQGITVNQIIKRGEPSPLLLEEIASGGYDLVAMATHGHRLLGDFIYGSVSETIKHAIAIPILLIKAPFVT
jgi:nucleotide-binding universal stress UspA family protein